MYNYNAPYLILTLESAMVKGFDTYSMFIIAHSYKNLLINLDKNLKISTYKTFRDFL